MRKNGWTREEEQYVRDNHEKMTDKEMAEDMPERDGGLPRRTENAVANRRVRLGFSKYEKRCKPKPGECIPDRSKSRFGRVDTPHWHGFIQPNRR